MTINKPIRANVDTAGLLAKIDRMFDASPVTVFSELLQNSRRAGAKLVTIIIKDNVIYEDDGKGVEDPAILLNLAARGWDDATQDSEDPAGMGFFCLSGFEQVHVESLNWRGTLTPLVFRGEWEFDVREVIGESISGFRALWHWPDKPICDLTTAVLTAAEFCGIEMVRLVSPGSVLEFKAKDFLDGLTVTEYPELGVRIGVARDSSSYRMSPLLKLNFKGVRVFENIEQFEFARSMDRYSVKVDVQHSRALKLVLPARNALMHGPERTRLLAIAELEIFKHIAAKEYGQHYYPFRVRAAALALGVNIGESQRSLRSVGDDYRTDDTGPWTLMDWKFGAVSRALMDLELGQLKHESSEMEGYVWYDSLPSVAGVTVDLGNGPVDVTSDALTDFVTAAGQGRAQVFVKVPKIELCVTLSTGEIRTVNRKCLAVVTSKEAYASNLDSDASPIFLLESATGEDVEEIADYLLDAIFEASEDSEADAWETQQREFMAESTAMVAAAIEGEEAGLLRELGSCLSRFLPRSLQRPHVRWSVHKDFDGEYVLDYLQTKPEEDPK